MDDLVDKNKRKEFNLVLVLIAIEDQVFLSKVADFFRKTVKVMSFMKSWSAISRYYLIQVERDL